MKLTAKVINAAAPKGATYKLFDGGGLHLEVTPKGGKRWRVSYRYAGTQKRLSLGVYPAVTLKDARERAQELKKVLAQGVNPADERKREKQRRIEERATLQKDQRWTLRELASRWMQFKRSSWTTKYMARVEGRLDRHILRVHGKIVADDIPRELLVRQLQAIADVGHVDTAYRLGDYLRSMYEWGIDNSSVTSNPAIRLRRSLPSRDVKHMAHFDDPARMGEYLRAIDAYQGSFETVTALKVSPLVILRPGEIRQGRWSEIDWDQQIWRKPAATMKSRRIHVVPLSLQAVYLLRGLHGLTGACEYMFPSVTDQNRPMSENTVRAALRRMGFAKDEITPHGFRGTASTFLHEQGWPTAVIEAQLAHLDQNRSRAAYNHATYLPQRREMLQAWADYLDRLRASP